MMKPPPHIAMLSPRTNQMGAASVAIAMLMMFILVAAVLAIQNMSGSSAVDSQKSEEQVAALFLAESGVERATGILTNSIYSGSVGDSYFRNAVASGGTTTGTPPTSSFGLGRGNFIFDTNTTSGTFCSPSGCTGTACTSCTVNVTGKIGSAERSIVKVSSFSIAFGSNGCGSTPTMNLVNNDTTVPTGAPVVGVFSLSWRRHISSGQLPNNCPSATTGGPGFKAGITCPGSAAFCGQQWYNESSNGTPSAGSMGTALRFLHNSGEDVTFRLFETNPITASYSLVGAIFPAADPSSAVDPIIKGSYWAPGNTTSSSSYTGQTNSGVAATDPVVCTALPINNTLFNTSQSCNSWCFGADTLVFGLASRSTDVSGQVTDVRFNTTATTNNPAQNVTMQHPPKTWLAHIPDPGGGTANATGDIFSEIWYAFNPNYFSEPNYFSAGITGAGATSYPRAVKGTIGAHFTARLTNNSTTMVVTSVTAGKLTPNATGGDALSTFSGPDKLAAGTTITAQVSGTTGGAGTYTLSNQATGTDNTADLLAASNTLYVTGTTRPLNTGVTNAIASLSVPSLTINGSGTNTYTFNGPLVVANGAVVPITQGVSSNTTIYLPTGISPPSEDNGTIVAVFNNSGVAADAHRGYFPAGTTATVDPAIPNQFTVSNPPAAGIVDAVICGGICALFNTPSSGTSVTNFQITATPNAGFSGSSQWAGGFVCLSGVDKNGIKAVIKTGITSTNWAEVVR